MGAAPAKQTSTLRYARFLSVISISFTLFMLGALTLVLLFGQGLSREIRQRVHFSVMLDKVAENELQSKVAELKAYPFVAKVELISADSAAAVLSELLGEDPVKVVGYNPLSPTAKVYLKPEYVQADSLQTIVQRYPLLQEASTLQEQETQWSAASQHLRFISWGLLAALLLSLLVSFLQINTATGLVIYSQRMRIRTLSLVGASAGFIRRPFVLGALANGALGACLALSLLALGLLALRYTLAFDIFAYCSWMTLLAAAVFVFAVGICVCVISSWRASRKYIHMEEGKIHLI